MRKLTLIFSSFVLAGSLALTAPPKSQLPKGQVDKEKSIPKPEGPDVPPPEQPPLKKGKEVPTPIEKQKAPKPGLKKGIEKKS